MLRPSLLILGFSLFAFGVPSAMAASESEKNCLSVAGSTWESSTKTCTPPAVVEEPGAPNKGNAEWVTETTIEAHGTIKNKFTETTTTCEGPGGSTSKC